MIPPSGARAGSAAMAFALAGCGDPLPDVRYETDRIEIATYFDTPVCTGSVADLDRFVGEVERRAGLQADGRVRFYWGREGIDLTCPASAAACAVVGSREAFSMLRDAPHEIAHVVGGSLGPTDRFLAEGFATTTTGDCVRVSFAVRPEELVDPSLSAVAFSDRQGDSVAGSFVRELVDRFGPGDLHRLMKAVPEDATLSSFESAVAKVYGAPLGDLEDAWALHAPPESCGPPWPFDESGPQAYSLVPLSLSADLDCTDVGTKGPIDPTVVGGNPLSRDPVQPGMYADFTVVVPFVVPVVLTVDGDPSTGAELRAVESWERLEAGGDPPFSISVSPGEPVSTSLPGGVLYVALTSSNVQPTSVTLRIEPDEGDG